MIRSINSSQRKFRSLAATLAILISGVIVPTAPASAMSAAWPSSTLDTSTELKTDGATNTAPLTFVLSNAEAGSTALNFVRLRFEGFALPAGFSSLGQTRVDVNATSANPFVFSTSGELKIEVFLDNGASKQIQSFTVGNESLDFGFPSAWTGSMTVKILAGQLTAGNTQPRSLSLSGWGLDSGNNFQLFYSAFISYSSMNNPNSSQSQAETPTPAKYSGPEFSSLSLKPVMHGSSTTLTGKRLSQVSSIEIGGKAATFTSISDTELSLTPAADLAPGTYDLVIHSLAGTLTHINAVRVQPALRPFSITTRSENRISETQYYEHSLIAAMQQPELTKARCIVNGSNLALAKAQAERLCALVAAANPNIETTVIEPRSTVRNNTVFARVTYGWN